MAAYIDNLRQGLKLARHLGGSDAAVYPLRPTTG